MKDRIRAIRKHYDLTQAEFGERIGVKGNTITNYENMIADKTNWKQKFEENDKAWREKYKARFYSDADTKEKKDDVPAENSDGNKNYTFDNLFNGGK